MSSTSLPEEKKEDDKEDEAKEIEDTENVPDLQESPVLENQEYNLNTDISEPKQQLLETKIGLECGVCNAEICNCWDTKQQSEKVEEARVSIPSLRSESEVKSLEKEDEGRGSLDKVIVEPAKSESEAAKEILEYPEEEEEGEGFDYKLPPPPPPELYPESEETFEEDLFGEEPWAPCDEIAEQMYGESALGEGEGEEGESGHEELGEEEEEEELEALDEKISMDSEYLKSSLGAPLTYALLDIIAKRPTDPIHYLGHYLIRWRANGESKDKYEKEVEVLTAERQTYMENFRERERQKMLAKEQETEEYRRAGKMESSLEDDDESGDEDEEDDITRSEKESVTLGD